MLFCYLKNLHLQKLSRRFLFFFLFYFFFFWGVILVTGFGSVLAWSWIKVEV